MSQGLFSRTPSRIQSSSLLRKSFLTAGLLFAAVCLIGLFTKLIVDQTGAISDAVSSSRFDTSFFKLSSAEANKIKVVFGFGSLCILASSIMTLFWVFRLDRASKAFIIANYIIFALGQGIGFGSLFIVFKAFELIAIFGIAGGIFLVMAGVGFLIKDGTKLMPFMIAGFVASLIIGIISMAMYFAGVYSDKLIMLSTFLTGALTCLYIVFDIWYIRTSDQFYRMQIDADTEFRLVAFMGFRLASDLITLVWTVARFYLRNTR